MKRHFEEPSIQMDKISTEEIANSEKLPGDIESIDGIVDIPTNRT